MTDSRTAIKDLLLEAGWSPKRRNSEDVVRWSELLLNDGFELVDGWRPLLLELGALTVGTRGAGIRQPRCPIVFDPSKAWGESDRFAFAQQMIGCALSPIGETADGYSFVGLSDDGGVYLVMDSLFRAGADVWEGLAALFLGRGVELVGHLVMPPSGASERMT